MRALLVFAWCCLMWCCLFWCWAGCGASPETPVVSQTGRKVCGWESLEDIEPHARRPGEPPPPKLDATPRLALTTKSREHAQPGAQVLVLEVAPDVTFATLREALAPAAETLVRIKVLFDDRWLVPMTARGRVPVKPPPKSETVESVVGKRILRRPRGAPADRFADLRLERSELLLYVENENPAGKRLRVAELRAALRRIDPPATVFALTATDETTWRELAAVLLAAACYDRGPDDEPHEVILD